MLVLKISTVSNDCLPFFMNWHKLSEDQIKDGWRKILARTFLMPNGKEAVFEIEQEPEIACVVAFTPEKRIVIAKQFRPGPEKVLWELPGGIIDPGETPVAAAARELLEETGYQGEIEYIGTAYDCAYSTGRRQCFIVKNAKIVQAQTPEENEFITVETLDLPAFRHLLRSGELTDPGVGYLALDYLNLL